LRGQLQRTPESNSIGGGIGEKMAREGSDPKQNEHVQPIHHERVVRGQSQQAPNGACQHSAIDRSHSRKREASTSGGSADVKMGQKCSAPNPNITSEAYLRSESLPPMSGMHSFHQGFSPSGHRPRTDPRWDPPSCAKFPGNTAKGVSGPSQYSGPSFSPYEHSFPVRPLYHHVGYAPGQDCARRCCSPHSQNHVPSISSMLALPERYSGHHPRKPMPSDHEGNLPLGGDPASPGPVSDLRQPRGLPSVSSILLPGTSKELGNGSVDGKGTSVELVQENDRLRSQEHFTKSRGASHYPMSAVGRRRGAGFPSHTSSPVDNCFDRGTIPPQPSLETMENGEDHARHTALPVENLSSTLRKYARDSGVHPSSDVANEGSSGNSAESSSFMEASLLSATPVEKPGHVRRVVSRCRNVCDEAFKQSSAIRTFSKHLGGEQWSSRELNVLEGAYVSAGADVDHAVAVRLSSYLEREIGDIKSWFDEKLRKS
jgi:hypothetical protein